MEGLASLRNQVTRVEVEHEKPAAASSKASSKAFRVGGRRLGAAPYFWLGPRLGSAPVTVEPITKEWCSGWIDSARPWAG